MGKCVIFATLSILFGALLLSRKSAIVQLQDDFAKGGKNIIHLIVVSMLIVATFWDLKTYRIPNKLTALVCVLGLLYSGCVGGFHLLGKSVLGMLLPVGILFIFYVLKVVGAGDVKLLAGLGTFFYFDVVYILILTMIIVAVYGMFLLVARWIRGGRLGKDFVLATRMHMSVPICIATIAWLFGGEFHVI
ncbi:MAG: prepilin peptidase [Lachnospiraceae bacterium]|nr:prepilin peptidase [Lachnospiraceae bacterium]